MSRGLVATVGAAAALAWAGVDTLEIQIADVSLLVETTLLRRAPDAAVFAAVADWQRWRILDQFALLPVLSVVFGGLPLALAAIGADRLRRRPVNRRLIQFACYPCFALQLVSVSVSAVLLSLLLLVYSELDAAGLCFMGYLGAQLVVGVSAVPAWKRNFEFALRMRIGSRFLQPAV